MWLYPATGRKTDPSTYGLQVWPKSHSRLPDARKGKCATAVEIGAGEPGLIPPWLSGTKFRAYFWLSVAGDIGVGHYVALRGSGLTRGGLRPDSPVPRSASGFRPPALLKGVHAQRVAAQAAARAGATLSLSHTIAVDHQRLAQRISLPSRFQRRLGQQHGRAHAIAGPHLDQ